TVTVDAASGVYSDPTTLRATVSPATYLDQTISGNVQFSVDGNPVGGPVAVNSSGVATTSYTVIVPAGAHTITAAFTSTNTAFLNSSNTGTLTVSREDADVSPSAANAFAIKVNSPGGTGGPVTLCFDMNEVSDGSPGDTNCVCNSEQCSCERLRCNSDDQWKLLSGYRRHCVHCLRSVAGICGGW